MRALDRKLMRDLRRIWAQTLAIALVLGCGIMVMVGATGTTRSLTGTLAAYYDRYRFADLFVTATRVPRAVLDDLAAIEGVAQVDGRVAFGAVLDLEGVAAPAVAQVLSLAADPGAGLNLPVLRRGRLPDPDRPGEVALNEPFAAANGLTPGSRFRAVLNGRLTELEVTGWLLSPEFVFTVAPGNMMPDDRRFGLVWLSEPAAAALTGMQGAVTDISLRLMRGADARAVADAVDARLDAYGGTGTQTRDRQTSHAFLASELQQLGAMAVYLPPVFLLVAAFLVNMVLGRLIALERSQIGLMRALGYSRVEIGVHYAKLATLIGMVGVALGWAAGWWMGEGMLSLYADFFRFPFLLRDPAFGAMAASGVVEILTALAGAARPVWAAMRLPPAEAMQPRAPPRFACGRADRLLGGLRLRQTAMMIVRSILRWPGRAAITMAGVAASVAVLVASYFLLDAVGLVRERVFDQGNRQHVTLTLARPAPASAARDALALPGVIGAEGVHAVPVRLVHEHRSRRTVLIASDAGATLVRVIDDMAGPVDLPAHGVILPRVVADELGIAAGETLRIEVLGAPRPVLDLPVSQVIRQGFGAEVRIAAPVLFAAMQVAPQVNQIHLRIDREALAALLDRVKTLPAVAGFADWVEVRGQFDANLDENLLTMVFIYTAVGVLIAIGVVYNAARIQLSERRHELATLRVLGFTRREVGFVLVGEMMLLTLLALPLGWGMGYGFAMGTAEAVSTDVVQLPFVVSRRTFALASVAVVVAAQASVLMVRRRLDRVDLAGALKAQG